MVDFHVDRETAVGEAFDQVHFPERAAAVEQSGVQPRDEVHQLGDPSGRG